MLPACSVLARAGLIRITTATHRRIRLVVFNNLLPDYVPIHEKYDLKGSYVARKVKVKAPPVLEEVDLHSPPPPPTGAKTLKDQNLVEDGLALDGALTRFEKVVGHGLRLAEGRRAGLAGCCCAACPCAECDAIDCASSPAESAPKAACVCSASGGSSGAPSGPITSRSAPPCEGQCAP